MYTTERRLYKRALAFASFIVFYNIIEGLISISVGYMDKSLTLFGFGVDSFIEVASNLGVIYMIKRVEQHSKSSRTPFENTALRITGYSFYLLSFGLAIGIVENIINKGRSENTLWGVVISVLSIGVMYYIATSQIKTGKALGSAAIVADAKCTMVCVYMSIVLLVSSAIYQFTGFGYADAIGAAGLIYFSVREGRDALEKARGKACCES